jgi:hypothetical protein
VVIIPLRLDVVPPLLLMEKLQLAYTTLLIRPIQQLIFFLPTVCLW